MQPDDLAEIEGNDLAQATMSLVDRIRPHLITIAAAIGVAFAGLAAWTLVSSQRDAEKAQAWDACLSAVAARDAATSAPSPSSRMATATSSAVAPWAPNPGSSIHA